MWLKPYLGVTLFFICNVCFRREIVLNMWVAREGMIRKIISNNGRFAQWKIFGFIFPLLTTFA